MLKKILCFFIIVSLSLSLLAGCNIGNKDCGKDKENSKEIAVEKVVFDKTDISLKVGESANISVSIFPENAKTDKLSWISSNLNVAIVMNGVVSALSEGTTTITATSRNGKYSTCVVTVSSDETEEEFSPCLSDDVILSRNGDKDFPNSITYEESEEIVLPRGKKLKFIPTQSGTYLITSQALDPQKEGNYLNCEGRIFTPDDFEEKTVWYTYENVDRFTLSKDERNVYMLVYLEAYKEYYISIAYYDICQEGTINFRVERLGGEGYHRFSLASPRYFTGHEDAAGEIISGGIDVELGADNIWREKRTDGREGSILYADFVMSNQIFVNTIEQMIELGSFDFRRTEKDQFILKYLELFDNDPEKCDIFLRELWGEHYESYAETFQLQDVYQGIYHGNGEDYTELAKKYLAKRITVGYNADLNETIEEGDERLGCVIVTDELADVLQMLMDKYTFEGVKNSWTKLCYYHQYFCEDTPF